MIQSRSKFNSKLKKKKLKDQSLPSTNILHILMAINLMIKTFSYNFKIKILQAYQEPFTMLVEEGTYISNHWEVLLNSKKEWHQAKIIRTTTKVVQGGADVLRKEGGA